MTKENVYKQQNNTMLVSLCFALHGNLGNEMIELTTKPFVLTENMVFFK